MFSCFGGVCSGSSGICGLIVIGRSCDGVLLPERAMPRRKARGKRIKIMRRGRLFCGGSGSFAGVILELWCLGSKHGCVLKEG